MLSHKLHVARFSSLHPQFHGCRLSCSYPQSIVLSIWRCFSCYTQKLQCYGWNIVFACLVHFSYRSVPSCLPSKNCNLSQLFFLLSHSLGPVQMQRFFFALIRLNFTALSNVRRRKMRLSEVIFFYFFPSTPHQTKSFSYKLASLSFFITSDPHLVLFTV